MNRRPITWEESMADKALEEMMVYVSKLLCQLLVIICLGSFISSGTSYVKVVIDRKSQLRL